MIEHYQDFVGKVCTILTTPTSFPFVDPRQYADFFTGRVMEISRHGVVIQNLKNLTKAFFSFPIVGIVEEQVITEKDPRFAQVKEQATTNMNDLVERARKLKEVR